MNNSYAYITSHLLSTSTSKRVLIFNTFQDKLLCEKARCSVVFHFTRFNMLQYVLKGEHNHIHILIYA